MVRRKFRRLKKSMDERLTRLWAGAEAEAIGHGGIAAVARATGLAISTVTTGRNEVRAGADGVTRLRIPSSFRRWKSSLTRSLAVTRNRRFAGRARALARSLLKCWRGTVSASVTRQWRGCCVIG